VISVRVSAYFASTSSGRKGEQMMAASKGMLHVECTFIHLPKRPPKALVICDIHEMCEGILKNKTTNGDNLLR